MDYGFRQRLRRVIDYLRESTRVLGWLGFGQPKEPPTEPIHRDDSSSAANGGGGEMHEQQHVDPGKRTEIDHPTE